MKKQVVSAQAEPNVLRENVRVSTNKRTLVLIPCCSSKRPGSRLHARDPYRLGSGTHDPVQVVRVHHGNVILVELPDQHGLYLPHPIRGVLRRSVSIGRERRIEEPAEKEPGHDPAGEPPDEGPEEIQVVVAHVDRGPGQDDENSTTLLGSGVAQGASRLTVQAHIFVV